MNSMSDASTAVPPVNANVHLNADAAAAPLRAVKRKTRITIYLDDEVLQEFRTRSEQSGKGYQTLINAALRTGLNHADGATHAE